MPNPSNFVLQTDKIEQKCPQRVKITFLVQEALNSAPVTLCIERCVTPAVGAG